ncbi:hypothetical protein E8E14_011476 [Neopestalotiopsis sp. 37M]|nr:hypothetical protein E8E14_011476 [Neopestalotiopsis sp. 37M]
MSSFQHRSCLSAEPHVDNIKESLLHFLGCVNISERFRLLNDDSHPVWVFETQHHVKNGKPRGEAEKLTKQKREKWKSACLSELRRIKFLRRKLEDDIDEGELVTNVQQSRKEWEDSEEYQKGIELVREWKKRPEYNGPLETNDGVLDDEPDSVEEVYKPERDVNVPIIQFNDGNARDFKVLEDVDGKKVWGSFPDQKTTVEHLLDGRIKEQNILYREKKDKNTIKYFHLPSNNMTWAEEAVSRYFNEDRPEFHKLRRKIGTVAKTEAAMILKESHWRGQLHGGQNSVNSRFMRPFCEALSSSVTEVDHIPKDIVLFMPYLHWETSRNRERFAQKIEQIVDKSYNKVLDEEIEEKGKRQKAREFLLNASKTSSTNQSTRKSWLHQSWDGMTDCFNGSSQKTERQPPQPTAGHPSNRRPTARVGRILSIGAAVQRQGYPNSPVKIDDTGRLRIVYEEKDKKTKKSSGARKGSRLGQYLIDAARLFEAITNYRDKCLLERFLMDEAPVHPRRTLDQAFYWTLEQTRSRDRDQVVYRATTAKGADFHKYKFDDQVWPQHSELSNDETCRDCSDNIKKVSRVVMVDQLWMWILDANTIITCFPKRYGANKHDSSGIHKSIRTRIGDKRHQQVKSVFDLALIIFEECSNTFFDRTKTSDKQPQVLDAFSEAIGNIMHKQMLAFERLWRWTKKARSIYKSRARPAASKLHVPLLDITPEGELEKEIKDILEELGIMIYVNNTHLEVLNQFIRHVKHILDPHTELAGKDAKVAASRQRLGVSRRASEANVLTIPVMDEKVSAEKQQKDTYDWFNINADETLTRVRDRIDQLQELQRIANDAATSVKDLLELKQQQAGVVQAWQSVRQSDEANSQGRAIMVFTIVTIVFLPLSFMSSVFGMNTKEFGGDDNLMSLREQFIFIAGISAPVIFLTFLFSLSNWIRSALACLIRFCFLWLSARTGLYQFYLKFNLPSHGLHDTAMNATDDLLKRQMELYSERKWDKFQAKEALDKEAETTKKMHHVLQQISSAGSVFRGSQSGGSLRSKIIKTALSHSDEASRTASRFSGRRSTPVIDEEAPRPVTLNGST